jgi:phenylalanyl-tRNA synthetase beta chain
VTVAEIRVDLLENIAELVPHMRALPLFPAMNRDLNLVLAEAVSWEQLEQTVVESAGPLLESVRFAGQYRGQQIAAGKKSYLVTMDFRAAERTLTTEEVDEAQQRILAACQSQLEAELR